VFYTIQSFIRKPLRLRFARDIWMKFNDSKTQSTMFSVIFIGWYCAEIRNCDARGRLLFGHSSVKYILMETQAKTPDKQAAKLYLVHQNIEAIVMKGHLTSQISSYRCEKYTSVQPYKLLITLYYAWRTHR